jgi:hypothetical protein
MRSRVRNNADDTFTSAIQFEEIDVQLGIKMLTFP